MKKTAIALLALASFSLAQADDETMWFSMGSQFIYEGESYDAYETLWNNSVDEVNAMPFIGTAGYAHTNTLNVTMNISDLLFTGDEGYTTALGTNTQIMAIQMIARPDGNYENPCTLTITIDGQQYTSGQGLYLATANTYGIVSFSFATPVALPDSTETLTFSVTGSDFGYGEFSTANGATLTELRPGQTYQPVFRVHGTTVVSTVPEPAAATLSLLALAGLAARRRRH